MAENRKEEIPVPLPGQENEAEHRRVRRSNDQDQEKERRGEPSRHNEGYDEAARGGQPTEEKVIGVTDE